jgi:4-hydroxybenzoate polyprenyltransferase
MCLVEARPCVLVIFFLRLVASTVLARGIAHHVSPAGSLVGALAWEAAIFSIYLFNGAMDVEEDRINGSRRPIARGALSADAATAVAAVTAVVSLACGFAADLPIVAPLAAVLTVGYMYSGPPFYLKRQPVGTAAAGGVLGLLTYYAGFTGSTGTAAAVPGAPWLAFVVTMSLWMGLVGVPAKDLGDLAGDAAAGRRTLPVVCGEPMTRVVIATAAVLVAAVFCVVAVHISAWLAGPGVALLGGAVVVTAASFSRLSRGDRARRRLPYRAFMLTQFAVNISVVASWMASVAVSHLLAGGLA